MIIKREISLNEFDAWCGGFDTLLELSQEQTEILEENLIDCFPNGMTVTELNDFLWFERDVIAEWLGFEDWEMLTSA